MTRFGINRSEVRALRLLAFVTYCTEKSEIPDLLGRSLWPLIAQIGWCRERDV